MRPWHRRSCRLRRGNAGPGPKPWAGLMPDEGEVLGLAALVRYAEARAAPPAWTLTAQPRSRCRSRIRGYGSWPLIEAADEAPPPRRQPRRAWSPRPERRHPRRLVPRGKPSPIPPRGRQCLRLYDRLADRAGRRDRAAEQGGGPGGSRGTRGRAGGDRRPWPTSGWTPFSPGTPFAPTCCAAWAGSARAATCLRSGHRPGAARPRRTRLALRAAAVTVSDPRRLAKMIAFPPPPGGELARI